jgi:hypothetical protein
MYNYTRIYPYKKNGNLPDKLWTHQNASSSAFSGKVYTEDIFPFRARLGGFMEEKSYS